MEVILQGNEMVLQALRPMKKTKDSNRLLRYCVEADIEKGTLIFNLLTRELLLLDQKEYHSLCENDYLKDHWFVVPENTKDKEYADFVRWMLKNRKKKTKAITNYSIFTTMDCNARCFYCYEQGRPRTPMSKETAGKVVQYIKEHHGDKKVNLAWYGGEPLYNLEIIDIICGGLVRENVEFTSTMISNGYLFDEDIIQKAVDFWKLKTIQITLDGTEKVYNRTKAYVGANGNPYQRVLDNIKILLDKGVHLQIRMNMDMHNAKDLMLLVEELSEKFSGRSNIHVYSYPIFKPERDMAGIHSDEEWDMRFEAKRILDQKIGDCGLASKRGLNRNPTLNYCMADSGNAITIVPDGSIGLCDHHSEDEFIGHIDREGFDEDVIASWKERIPEIPACEECFYYSECCTLRKCKVASVCFAQMRTEYYRETQRAMLAEYEQWKKGSTKEDNAVPEV